MLLFMIPIIAVALQASSQPLTIETVHGTLEEEQTATQLARLNQTYDLRNRIWTTHIQIDGTAIPHSHPILTLHNRHLDDDIGLLSTFLHEQLHWFVNSNLERRNAAMAELALLYPDIPVGYPEGARDAQSNALHLIVCFLELTALAEQIGMPEARDTLRATRHYTEIYRIVLEDTETIGLTLARHGIVLPAAP